MVIEKTLAQASFYQLAFANLFTRLRGKSTRYNTSGVGQHLGDCGSARHCVTLLACFSIKSALTRRTRPLLRDRSSTYHRLTHGQAFPDGLSQAMKTDDNANRSAEADLGGNAKQQATASIPASVGIQRRNTSDNAITKTIWTRAYNTLTWTPPNCRWNPEEPPNFSTGLNVLFAFAGAFTVANLYYNQPILNILAEDFGVDYADVSQIPTLAQAGYAVGLLFLCPMGDLLKRRPFVLSLIFFTATMW